ncbi:uracil-DNA glycosylase [Paraburkholderia sp. Tr-20389]|uniref:uracil-DNA glycosylase n=1 Tax=Paraburkholderia sp. Tr-20389 TaxID=2703903 RepID=UPI00197FCF72|nr:uracil-DNA glycosylase [Paraburkholderia sp. Tr-20389]MBN3753429.1 uracil-DNA glycosylase [Paraburkholderia sp. Tr-20389]
MALHESALEELGLAPMWVRRAGAHDAAVEPQASHDDADVVADVAQSSPAATPVGIEDVRVDELARADAQVSNPAQSDAGVANAASEPAASRESARAEVDASPADAPQSRRAPPSATDDVPPFPDDDFAWFDDLPAGPPSNVDASTNEPAQPGIDTLDWTALEARVSACERCRLCERRTNTVFGVGDREADWMLIGEAPGENEDKQGEPFVGQAGKLLDNMLRSLDLARGTNVYIANVIKCRPPGNRNPEPDEVARCEPYLQRQVALVKPKLIVALGRFAAQSLLKTEASISSLRGRVHEYEGVPVVVTYHPAYLLRSLGDKAKSWQDLCLARDTWQKAGAEGNAGDAAK